MPPLGRSRSGFLTNSRAEFERVVWGHGRADNQVISVCASGEAAIEFKNSTDVRRLDGATWAKDESGASDFKAVQF